MEEVEEGPVPSASRAGRGDAEMPLCRLGGGIGWGSAWVFYFFEIEDVLSSHVA